MLAFIFLILGRLLPYSAAYCPCKKILLTGGLVFYVLFIIFAFASFIFYYRAAKNEQKDYEVEIPKKEDEDCLVQIGINFLVLLGVCLLFCQLVKMNIIPTYGLKVPIFHLAFALHIYLAFVQQEKLVKKFVGNEQKNAKIGAIYKIRESKSGKISTITRVPYGMSDKEEDRNDMLEMKFNSCVLVFKYDKALEYLAQMEEYGCAGPETHTTASQVYIALENYEKALEHANKALMVEITNVEAMQSKFTALYNLNKIDEAKVLFCDLESKNANTYLTYIYMALIFYDEENYKAALVELDKSIKLNDKTAWTYYVKSDCLYKLGDIYNAVSVRKKAQKLDKSK